MASTSEVTFGARLRKAQDLLQYITGFQGYAPPRTEDSIIEFGKLLTSIQTANSTVAVNLEQYTQAVDDRSNAFRKKENSIDKSLTLIKSAVEAQFGRTSKQVESVSSIIKTMRSTKLIKIPKSPDDPTIVQTISQSEQSYGSMTQNFQNLINTLAQFPEYNPSNEALKVANLKAFADSLTTMNNAVAQKFQALRAIRTSRSALYDDLKERVSRIKSYTKAQYGTKSQEYTLIKGINV
jgi:hypothetical protein